MNLILLHPDDYISEHRVRIYGRRCQHILSVHQADINRELKVGSLNGNLGNATVLSIHNANSESAEIELEVQLSKAPPAPLPLRLVLAMPRPKMLRRILQTLSTMGVKQIHLINSYRVEKSYWQTPWLQPEKVREEFLLGLEQAGDTQLPELHIHKRFKPFVEDELPALAANTQALVAHPIASMPCPQPLLNEQQAVTLAIGPEGGFIAYEVEKLESIGFRSIHLGSRILRVETAIPVLLAKLFAV